MFALASFALLLNLMMSANPVEARYLPTRADDADLEVLKNLIRGVSSRLLDWARNPKILTIDTRMVVSQKQLLARASYEQLEAGRVQGPENRGFGESFRHQSGLQALEVSRRSAEQATLGGGDYNQRDLRSLLKSKLD